MNKVSKNIIKHLIEIVIVAFGVFMGVYFSNLNSNYKTEAEKKKALNLIIKELELNRELVIKEITYHESIKTQFDTIKENTSDEIKNMSFSYDNLQNISKINGFHGFNFAQIETTAFESAKVSGIMKEFDVELIQNISSIHKAQETYLKIGEKILDKALKINSNSRIYDFLAVLNLMTNDLLGIEKDLKKDLDHTIDLLKTSK